MSGSANQDFQTPHRQPLHTDLPPVYRPPGVAATIIQFTGVLWASQGMRTAGAVLIWIGFSRYRKQRRTAQSSQGQNL